MLKQVWTVDELSVVLQSNVASDDRIISLLDRWLVEQGFLYRGLDARSHDVDHIKEPDTIGLYMLGAAHVCATEIYWEISC